MLYTLGLIFQFFLLLIAGYLFWYILVRVTLLAYFNTLSQIKRTKLRRAALAAVEAAQKQHPSVH